MPKVSYIIPRTHDVVLGGSVCVGDDSADPPEDHVKGIIEDAALIIPEIAQAEILKTWAGYRPGRSTVRLELLRGEEPPTGYPTVPQLPPVNRLSTVFTAESVAQIQADHEAKLQGRSEQELEWDSDKAEKVPIVHNYGHSGSGITLHMGCALEVVELVKQVLQPDGEKRECFANEQIKK